MKKIIFILGLLITVLIPETQAQIFSADLMGHYGSRVIYYPYGYYQGEVMDGIAEGVGTFYFQDGSFYHGYFQDGFWHGEGMLVSPYYGYMTGCWNQGNFIGACPYNNDYEDSDHVQEIVHEVQAERPRNTNYTAISPEGYSIKRIDADTKMGKRLLGRYSGN